MDRIERHLELLTSSTSAIVDFPSRHVSGSIVVNNAAQSCNPAGRDGSPYIDGNISVAPLNCDANGHLVFDGYVAPGQYTLSARGGDLSQFPRGLRTLGGLFDLP